MSKCLIGVPREVKPREGRVGITPLGARVLCALGAEVGIEQDAGLLSGFSDWDYLSAGASIHLSAEKLYKEADVIVKVKEPTPEEYPMLELLRGKTIFAYLHLAGVDPELTKLLLRHNVTAIAYENVARTVVNQMTFPLLAPMSKIAGVQAMRGALKRHPKERHCDLRVLILGGGNVGEAALEEALANGVASVSLFELRDERRTELRAKYLNRQGVSFFSFSALDTTGTELSDVDIVISGVMTPGGAAAPKVLTQRHFRRMKPGAYIADVAIDQGGSTAWSKPTKPGETFTKGKKGLVFSCVPNIPGSTVPKEATLALTEATFPYVKEVAQNGAYFAMKGNLELRAGLQTFAGFVTNPNVLKHCGMNRLYYRPTEQFFEL